MRKILLSWSSGKDSAWSLHRLRQDPSVEVAGLLTTVSAAHNRVAMHAVRRELLLRQARAAELTPWLAELPSPCSNAEYEAIMAAQIERARAEGIDAIAFGDLFLSEIRAYREQQMRGSGLGLLFPLWLPAKDESADHGPEATRYRERSMALAQEMQAAGVRAWITCIDPRALDASFAGREWDARFLRDLPPSVDPCGENGEFHSFVFAGPMLSKPVPVQPGEVVERDGFVFADLLPA